MAGLTVGVLLSGLSAIAASGYAYAEAKNKNPEGNVVYLSDGAKIRAGATVKLIPEAAAKYPGKGLTKPGSNFTGMVQFIDKTKGHPLIQVTNTVRTARLTDLYDPDDFTLIRPADETGITVAINGGVASVGTRVRYRKPDTATNSSPKSLANPFYNSVGTVESVDPQTKLVIVKATALKDSSITYTQEYRADELVFVSLPYNDDVRGIPTDYGFINVGSRVTLKQEKVMEFQKESKQLKKTPVNIPLTSLKIKLPTTVEETSSQKFLATPSVFEKVGVVTAVMFNNEGKHKAVVKCKHLNSTHYYDQEYNVEDLQVVGSDGVPIGTVFILGGIAESGVEVKLRDEKKDEAPGKCLSRPTYGHKGTVEDVDPTAGDNLKVQVRCVGSNDGEEGSDWYEPEQLELLEMPKDQGIAIFGGFAIVGTVVEVMVDALGVKCLGKPSVGNVGVVMGIDPNASGGETLNIKCGRDLRTNTKATNWYKPTDVKIYVKPDMSGSEQEIKEIQLIKKRSELLKEQTRRVITIQDRDLKAANIERITAEIKTLEDAIEAEKKKGTTLEGMRDLYNRVMEDLVKFRRTVAGIDEEYSTAKLQTTCNISDVSTESILRQEAEGIIAKYYDEAQILTIIPAAGQPGYVSDEPSDDPAELKRLEDAARAAVDSYNSKKTSARRKTAADNAVKALSDFKAGRQYQSPQTDSQKNYIKKRDELIEALRAIQPLGRTDILGEVLSNIPGILALAVFPDPLVVPNAIAPNQTARVAMPITRRNFNEQYNAYLNLVLQVEVAKNTHPNDPIGYLNTLPAPAAPAAPGVLTIPFGALELNAFINLAASQAAINAALASASPDVQQAGQNLQAAANAADANATAENIAKCKLAAYDLLVAVVENSPMQTIANRFLTKLYWEKRYKDSSAQDYSIADERSFDEMDIILRKLNEARDKFASMLNPAPDTPEAKNFRTLKKAFEDFDFGRQNIFDEVHGETTLLEQRIKIMSTMRQKQMLNLHKLNNEMMAAQKEYAEQVKREKFADFLVMNAMLKRKQEVDRYLTVSTPNPNPGGTPQQGGPNFGKKKKRGGAITSAEREINNYLARIFTNYIRINHYKSVILHNSSLPLSSDIVKDVARNATKTLYTKMITLLKQIFANTSTNNYLYKIVPLTATQNQAIVTAQIPRNQRIQYLSAERTRLMGVINGIFTDIDVVKAEIDGYRDDVNRAFNDADGLKTSSNRALAAAPPGVRAAIAANNAVNTLHATIVGLKNDITNGIDSAQAHYTGHLNPLKQKLLNTSAEPRELEYSVKLLNFYLDAANRGSLSQELVGFQARKDNLLRSLTDMRQRVRNMPPLERATQAAVAAATGAAAGPQASRQDRQTIARTAALTVRNAVAAEANVANMVNVANTAGTQANTNAAHAANVAGSLIQPAQASSISNAAVVPMINATQAAVAVAGATPASVNAALNTELGQIVRAQMGGGYTIRRPIVSRRNTRRVSRY